MSKSSCSGPVLEDLLTSPEGFALPASDAQRAIARIIRGEPLGALAENPQVQALVGGPEAIPLLPIGKPPTEVYVIAAARTAKTITSVAAALTCALSADMSGIRPGEIPRVVVVSLTLDHAKAAFTHLLGTMQARTSLRRLIIGKPTADSIVIRHPSGKPVEIKIVAHQGSGAETIARWLVALIIDEGPRMPWSGALRIQDIITSARVRLLPGGQILIIGAPWAAAGPVYDAFRKSFGKPSPELVILRGTGPMLNPSWFTPKRCASMLEQDKTAHDTDVLGAFASTENNPFAGDNTRSIVRQPEGPRIIRQGAPVVFIDSSAGRGDAFVWVLGWYADEAVDMEPHLLIDAYDDKGQISFRGATPKRDAAGNPIPNPNYNKGRRSLVMEQWNAIEGRFGGVIRASEIVDRIARFARDNHASRVVGDQFSAYTLESMFHERDVRFSSISVTAERKLGSINRLRRLIRERRLIVPPGPEAERLITELAEYRERLTSAGNVVYESPRSAGGGHGDRAAALVLAAMADAEGLIEGHDNWRPGMVSERHDHPEDYTFG